MKRILSYFSKTEILLWSISVLFIILSFLVFDRNNYLTLFASLIGVTSLIFNAKGNPIGPLLMVVFSIQYGVISHTFAYYGEMITYLGMTMPMSVLALGSWLLHPHNGNRAEVNIARMKKTDTVIMIFSAIAVTFIFYFVLERFDTANLVLSTLSVTTSYLAVYLTFRRSPYYALAYAANDIILILLWMLASISDMKYLSVVVCFAAFLCHDIYGFINWRKMKERQADETAARL